VNVLFFSLMVGAASLLTSCAIVDTVFLIKEVRPMSSSVNKVVYSIPENFDQLRQLSAVEHVEDYLKLNEFRVGFEADNEGCVSASDECLHAGQPNIHRGRKITLIVGVAVVVRANGEIARLSVNDYVMHSDRVVLWPNSSIEYDRSSAWLDYLFGGGSGWSVFIDASPCGFGGDFILPKFSWPPWLPTDEYGINFGARKSMGEVADYLSNALDRVGYSDHYAFSTVPGSGGVPVGGFAIVTDPEQILQDGRSVPAIGRWQDRLPRAGEVDFISFIRGLINAPEGRYRVIVFLVTDAPRSRSYNTLVGDLPLRELTRCGATKMTDLTAEMRMLRERPVNNKTDIRALVYEFKKQAEGQPIRFLKPGLSAQQHLEQAGIMTALVSRP
jgi:hypothetical protein